MKAVIYARYSSEKQQEISIDGQLRVCQEFAAREGYEVVDTYTDRALSASRDVERREDFQRMIRDSARRRFEVVIVYKFSRFARNRYDSAVYKARLRQNGVRVVSACEPISANPEGALIEGIFESLDEFYSKSLAQDVARGMHENASKALSTGGTIPLGYVSVDKRLQIDPATAPAVRMAFELYADGQSCAKIADALNAKGYRTRTGKLFNRSSFNSLFSNPKYIGTYHYNGEIELAGQVPAIVDPGTYRAVQARLRKNAQAPARAKATVDYLLSTKLYCGECGRPIAGESGHSHTGARYYYYACSGRKRRLGCTLPTLRKDDLERLVVEHARALLAPDSIRALAHAAAAEYARQAEDDSAAVSLRQQLGEVTRSIDNLIRMVEGGASSATLVNRLNELEARKADLSAELSAELRGVPELTEVDILRWLSCFADGSLDDGEYCRNVVDMLVNKIVVQKKPNQKGFGILIAYNLAGDEEELSGSDLVDVVHQFLQNPNPCTTKTAFPPFLLYHSVAIFQLAA